MVAKNRDQVYLVTKSDARDYDGFMRDVERSLKHLQTDRIDLMHIWNIRRKERLEPIEAGALKAIHQLQAQGVIKHFGITGHSGAHILMEAVKRFDPDALLSVFPVRATIMADTKMSCCHWRVSGTWG